MHNQRRIELDDITLRLAGGGDLEFMRELRNDNTKHFFHSEKVSKEDHKDWWDDFKGHFFIIMLGNIKVGTLSLTYNAIFDGMEVGNIIVNEPWRRKGILRKALEALKLEYELPFYLRVKGDNVNAIAAYESIGFTVKSMTMELK